MEDSRYDEAEIYFHKNGIEIRPFFYPASAHPYVQNALDSNLIIVDQEKITRQLNEEIIILPSFPGITISERQKVVSTVKNYISEIRK